MSIQWAWFALAVMLTASVGTVLVGLGISARKARAASYQEFMERKARRTGGDA